MNLANIKLDPTQLKALKKKLKDISNPIDNDTAKKAAKATREEMLDLISKGISPIKGNGRFPAYKDAKKYPGKRKSARPVNLKLSGDFLNSLQARVKKFKDGFGFVIGYFDNLSKLKEQGHREGANKQRKRPSIPEIDKREQFAERIQVTFLKIFNKRIAALVKK